MRSVLWSLAACCAHIAVSPIVAVGLEAANPAVPDLPATCVVTSPSPGIRVTEPVLLVRGNVLSPSALEIGVTINGIVAKVANGEFAEAVAVRTGTDALDVRAYGPAGLICSTSLPLLAELSTDLEDPLSVAISPSIGFAPLHVTLKGAFSGNGTEYQWIPGGPGSLILDEADPSAAEVLYDSPGLRVPALTVTDQSGNRVVRRAAAVVLDENQLVGMLEQKWEGVKAALRARDAARALSFVAFSRRDQYANLFSSVVASGASIDQVMTDIRFAQFHDGVAEFKMDRPDERGDMSYLVRFKIDEDGIWRISAM